MYGALRYAIIIFFIQFAIMWQDLINLFALQSRHAEKDKGKSESIQGMLLVTLLFWYMVGLFNILAIWIMRMWKYDHKTLQYYYYKRQYRQLSELPVDNENIV